MLSHELSGEIPVEFLRLLGRPGAPVYLDAADALEGESSLRTGELRREDALALVERVVEQHAGVELEDAAGASARDKARTVLEQLIAARWLTAEDRADYQRFIAVAPNTGLLLEALRKIARPGAAEFSDKLVATCNLLRGQTLREEPWQTVEACMENVRLGVQELKQVAQTVERHTRRQLGARSVRENLAEVFDQYAQRVGHGAYVRLVHARLPTRLPEARDALERLRNDGEVLQRMAAEVQRRDENCDAATAMARAQNRLRELAEAIDRVIPSADDVDRRTADFTRKSLARFRYLQEVSGEQRGVVQRFFERLNVTLAGRRVRDAGAAIGDEIPALRLCEVEILAGLASLYPPRRRPVPGEVEPLEDEPSDEQLENSRRQLLATLRDSLTVTRANRFADAAFAKLGGAATSEQLLTTDEARDWRVSDDQIADVLACLLHAGARGARFEVRLPNGDLQNPAGDRHPHDRVLGRMLVERFVLTRR